jgi:hypothetical protein
MIAKTNPELVGADSASMAFFRLTSLGTRLLTHAPGNRLPVRITVRDATSGRSTTVSMTLASFRTTGRAATRQVSHTAVRVAGLTDFANSGGAGGILAGCTGVTVCSVTTTLSVGSTVIARTGTERIGQNEVAYLYFTLTRQGRALLAQARGNHLVTHVVLNGASGSAVANVALVQFR